jgi:phage N-6-adenine-methyltransferase
MMKGHKALTSTGNGEWETPEDFFQAVNKIYNFNLDPAATDLNAKCDLYFTKEQDGLNQSWQDKRVWINPPYGRGVVDPWVKRAYYSVMEWNEAEFAVMLLPARTDTNWFHGYIYDAFLNKNADIRFIKGRVNFVGGKSGSTFPSMLVLFTRVPVPGLKWIEFPEKKGKRR